MFSAHFSCVLRIAIGVVKEGIIEVVLLKFTLEILLYFKYWHGGFLISLALE